MKTHHSKTVADTFHQLTEQLQRDSTDSILQGLAEVFVAECVGLSDAASGQIEAEYAVDGTPPATYPWISDTALSDRLSVSLMAETHKDGKGEWLVSETWEPGGARRLYFWAFRSAKRGWSESDAWAWQFAGPAVARRCFPPAAAGVPNAEVERRLQHAATVTRKLGHDFANYLTGALGFTELSLSQVAPDSVAHGFLREVLQAVKSGADWIHRLHLFCGQSSGLCWPAQLASIVEEAEGRLRGAGVRGLRWDTSVPADLPLAALDADSIRLAFSELVKNTREATRDDATLRVSARVVELTSRESHSLLGAAAPGRFIELSVADDGPGIAPACRQKLFHELFFSTKPKHRGLGFLVVHGIMQRSGGALRIGAATEGKGAQVDLLLPVAPLDGPPLPGAEPPRLLLAQTDANLRESMKIVLESAGAKVTTATSGTEALGVHATSKKNFDLIVTQTHFPEGSAFDVARRILDRNPEAKFVFVVAQPFGQGFVDEELLNRFSVVRWPTDPKGFLQAVHAALAATAGADR